VAKEKLTYKEQIKKWAVTAGTSRRNVLKALLNIEGKTSHVKAGDMNEVLKVLIDLQVQARLEKEGGPLDILYTFSKDKLAKVQKRK
jgi:hypothetical protein